MMKPLKQVKIVNQESFKKYQDDFFEEPVLFEQYVNFELGQLYDQDHVVESITFSTDLETCVMCIE